MTKEERTHSGDKTVSSVTGVEQEDGNIWKNGIRTFSNTQNELKMNQRLKVWLGTTKITEENTEPPLT